MRDYLLVLGLGLITAYSPAFATEPPEEDEREEQGAENPAIQSMTGIKLKKVRTALTNAPEFKKRSTKFTGYIGGGHVGD